MIRGKWPEDLAAEFRDLRERMRLTQNQLADMLGLGRPAVHNYERCRQPIPLGTLPVMRLCADIAEAADGKVRDLLAEEAVRQVNEGLRP